MKWPSAELVEGTKLKLPHGWLPPEYYDALNVLFRVENALRVFVFVVLKNAHGADWANLSLSSDDSNAGTIASIARQRQEQDRKYGYLGVGVSAPLMFLTSGELIRLMLAEGEWKHFSKYFVATKELIRAKLEEIGNIRNALAHFRPLTVDDVQLVKTNARHVLVEVERAIQAILVPQQSVPTNTPDAWYASLNGVPTAPFAKQLRQSANEEWISLWLGFECEMVRPSVSGADYMNPGVLFLQTSAMLRRFPDLLKYVTCVSEAPPHQYGIPAPDELRFRKQVILTFGRPMLEANHEAIAGVVKSLCEKVAEESTLVQQDLGARGEIVKMVTLWGYRRKAGTETTWSCDVNPLSCKSVAGDASEYWGIWPLRGIGNWISATQSYPWTAESLRLVVDEDDIPF